MRREYPWTSFLCLLGVVLLIAAAVYAASLGPEIEATKNIVKGLAACGFAVAGGLCFVSAALTYLADQLRQPRGSEAGPPTTPANSTADRADA